ncbi:DUF488 domain-containing protein [Chitinophaga cymbidii]|uniref:DUF488 domain-containing protein n=1 Tax=Chitinophaga cymbidii TaxID=1096750 RepID=A0A512RH01_9BACT|nr:DUF488 domain-containing protein [Chitinophaga cymbidii]GEP94977.1 hypothetical protein CCY01nite_12370 [Chitinophaga cymbidii]
MFYRRKIILALLEIFEGELEKIRLQKLLFLFCQKQAKAEYEFVPYKYGCYSYSATADLVAMTSKNQVFETNKGYQKSDNVSYLKSLKPDDLYKLRAIKALHGEMDGNALMKYTYRNFPYWATKSVKASSILTSEELANVDKQRQPGNKTVLFTIGYEGESLENYLNRLIRNDVKALIDVRRNPLSMKFGFNKSLLKRYCESLGIIYLHFPEVGISSDKRQELNTQSDYDKLFRDYCVNDLPKTINVQKEILNLLHEHKRVALTCFEANFCQCHRSHLAKAISQLPNFSYEVIHI